VHELRFLSPAAHTEERVRQMVPVWEARPPTTGVDWPYGAHLRPRRDTPMSDGQTSRVRPRPQQVTRDAAGYARWSVKSEDLPPAAAAPAAG
jgi:hypothetical protein